MEGRGFLSSDGSRSLQLLWPSGTAEQHEEEEDDVQVDVKSAVDVFLWIQLNRIATNHLLDIKDEELTNQQDKQTDSTHTQNEHWTVYMYMW